MQVGDKVTMSDVWFPLTWWDRFLWRLFRIDRERPKVSGEWTVVDVYPGPQPDAEQLEQMAKNQNEIWN
jgi:hypothetical protein